MACQNANVRPDSKHHKTRRIARLNDLLRRGCGQGEMFITPGIIELGHGAVADVLALVRDFDDFTVNNDPHSEHDFGSLQYRGERIFWKIDYYDRSLQYGSEDPAEPTVTTRVLTIMLAREY
jgi:hypothetical protein